jgi:23S rRNA (adenine2503-C2)-methyltransferase
MKNLPGPLRDRLAEHFRLRAATIIETRGAPGATRKLLLELGDGERIEAVLIPAGKRTRPTVCVSSQVGCRFRCAFCASGQAGLRRNLEPGEMVAQALLAASVEHRPPSHVVFMGIGEPLDNVEAVLKAVRIINDHNGLDIGARRITISTCGIIPGIRRLQREGLQVELSVSLHAPTDALRSSLMPVNRKYPLRALLEACEGYARETKRIVTFEYTLIKGVNDSETHADQLARLLTPLPCRVNLIPMSPVEEYRAEPSPRPASARFGAILGKAGINTTLRASKGSRLKAACGQLRHGRETS